MQQFFKNAAEVWASSPHLRSKLNFATCFLCCNCIFKSCPIQTKLNHENQGCKFRQGNGAIAACWQAKAGVEPPFAGCWRLFFLRIILVMFHVKHTLRKITWIRFGRIASLSACVLFAGGCVVRIAYECFLDYSLLEVLCFQDGEQHLPISLRFQYHSLQPLLGRTACPPF